MSKHTTLLLPQVQAQHAALEDQLRAHGLLPANTPLHILANPTQGNNKAVFRLQAHDQEWMLLIHTPQMRPLRWQASLEQQHAFQQGMRAAGLPYATPLIPRFTLSGIPYACELYATCPGQQYDSLLNLSERGAQSLGDFLAKSHLAARHLRIAGLPIRHLFNARNLPHGVMHNDLPHNMFFDASGSTITGVIDCERVSDRPFTHELDRCLGNFLQFTTQEGAVHMTVHPHAQRMLTAYTALRPLQSNECDSLAWRIGRRAERKYRRACEAVGQPYNGTAMQQNRAAIATMLEPFRPQQCHAKAAQTFGRA